MSWPRLALIACGSLLLLRGAYAGDAVWLCTNPHSGATWRVRVDLDHSSVDAFPAKITARRITWRDTAHGGIYELDRASGALTVRYASSTGGYFLHDRCEPISGE